MAVTVAVTQFACSWDTAQNMDKAERLVREAAAAGANIICLQELFTTPYFCQDQDPAHFKLAKPLDGNPVIDRFAHLARELKVVLPISFFEREGNAHFNALAVADADGTVVGKYRKSHIPDGPGYNEKYYFSPGDTGFCVFHTRYAKVGALVCWDQWFPEAARACVLQGAELLLYPSAIGSEPTRPGFSSYAHWLRVQQGHAAANMVPIAVSNRVGSEPGKSGRLNFYGGSFIAGPTGEIVAQVGGAGSAGGAAPAAGAAAAGASGGGPAGGAAAGELPEAVEGFALASFDLEALAAARAE